MVCVFIVCINDKNEREDQAACNYTIRTEICCISKNSDFHLYESSESYLYMFTFSKLLFVKISARLRTFT